MVVVVVVSLHQLEPPKNTDECCINKWHFPMIPGVLPRYRVDLSDTLRLNLCRTSDSGPERGVLIS